MAKPKLSIASLATMAEPEALTVQQVNMSTSQQQVETSATESPAKRRIKSADKKLIGFRLTKSNARQLEKMAYDEETSVQAFLLKTINLYRQARGLSPLAE